MKATGIVRRIDDLGRVVIPKEIRRTMRIREGDPLEIFTEKDGEVVFKKYSPIGELAGFASMFTDIIAKNCMQGVVITDKDNIISVSGVSKKELIEKRISSEVERVIDERKTYAIKMGEIKRIPVSSEQDKHFCAIIAPIITSGDVVGSIVMLQSSESYLPTESDLLLINTGAQLLAKQMES